MQERCVYTVTDRAMLGNLVWSWRPEPFLHIMCTASTGITSRGIGETSQEESLGDRLERTVPDEGIKAVMVTASAAETGSWITGGNHPIMGPF